MVEILGVNDYDTQGHKCRCPYHHEKTPSFKYNPADMRFHCFGCNTTVDIVDVMIRKGYTFSDAAKQLFKFADMDVNLEESHKHPSNYRYPSYQTGDMTKIYDYLGKRKISRDTVDYLDITTDGCGNMNFNYYDIENKLLLVKARPARTIDKKSGQIKTWVQKNSDSTNILYNMNRVRPEGTLLICEGEIDCASFIEAGFYQCCSIPFGAGSLHWIDECWDWLQNFDEIIIAADNDEPGKKMTKEVTRRLGFTNTKYIEYPDYYYRQDEDGNIVAKIRTKDANDIAQTYGLPYLFQLVITAKETPIDSVIKMSDIEEMDIYSVDGIETGIRPLDRELVKLFCGGVTILTGKASAGKTTILNLISINAMDQGFSVFLYSRELLNSMSKNWYKTVGAGRQNMKQVTITDRRTGADRQIWVVTDEAKKDMDVYYSDKFYLYKDDEPNDADSIVATMERLAMRKGVKLFILDNLLTIALKEEKDGGVNAAQTAFINQLTRFSIRYNVCVILVAHLRKTAPGQEIGLDEISGSSNIINLATRTLALQRVSDKDKENEKCKYRNYDVLIHILKDRINGSQKTIPCHYDPRSRRFFTDKESLYKKFKWDKSRVDIDELEYEFHDEESPFV